MDDSPSYDNTDRDSDSELDSLYDGIKEHDDIRFATYRTAAKIRYVQRKGFFHHIDIWNVIEAFRENGLNTMEPSTLVNRARLETLLASLYSNLNKRLPPGQSINIEKTGTLLAVWLLFSLGADETNRLKVFSVKIALAVLACGKLMDKLRYIFSQLADCNGQLLTERFQQFIRELCKLPAAVGERRTYNANDSGIESIFSQDGKVNVNDFLETLMSDPGPHCVSWLIVLHRMTAAESNIHPVACAGCGREGFQGLRYKSDSANYHLCQMCFWRGTMSDEHKDDVFKEYSAWKTPGKPSGLRRSIKCIQQPGGGAQQRIPQFPEKPEHPLDLSNIVPASPLPPHNGFNPELQNRHLSSGMSGMDKLAIARLQGSLAPSPLGERRYGPDSGGLPLPHPQFATLPQPRLPHGLDKPGTGMLLHRGKNDEHELIARYANHLAGQQTRLDYLGLATPRNLHTGGVSSPEDDRYGLLEEAGGMIGGGSGARTLGGDKDSRRLVYELEKKNAEIMREIARLRQNRASVQDMERDPTRAELEVLRQRKAELENRLKELQETRKDLMTELNELMKLLRVQGQQSAPGPPPRMPMHDQQMMYRGGRPDDSVLGKSYQSCRFSQMTKHQNVSSKLRPMPFGLTVPYERGYQQYPAHQPSGGPGDGGGGMAGGPQGGATGGMIPTRGVGPRDSISPMRAGGPGGNSSPDSTSVPASVNSLSE